MKNNVRQLIKTVIEENAVAFKDQTAKVLYGKIGMRLQEQYKLVAKNIISKVLHEEEDSKEKDDFENSTKSSDVIVKGKTTAQRDQEQSTMNPSGNKTPKAKTLAQRRQEMENRAMNPSDNLRPKPEASDAQRRINNNQFHKEDKDNADYQNMLNNEYIEDQENTQKARVKNATKQEQSGRVSNNIAHAVVAAPVMTGSLGALGLMGLSTLPEGGALAGAAGALAAPAAVALGAAGAGYAGGKAIEAGMNYFDPEQKTYAKIGSALTGGPEKIERRGAPGTQAEYSNAARTAAAARKARYGSE